ncbi:polymer-forming cytoskeletal protein [Hathewaya limosa]|uniref:Cytoskeletal protein CcmA (Bactofilin family) n=1 Tax=Hathewaya limosa TaxID=1536 RepID=A0ABU0JT94_HATLI|nr:polymer-forming cytoskeletal protein [Hathewaya limosa]MDQ0479378.1 cytoskeletal protein CcmA (bactofilin family) [Hathewaya limosa]
MENNELGNLYISGSGRCSGGKFRSVKILGSGKIVGDIECEDFKISGSGKVEGNIFTKDFKISGSGNVEGAIVTNEFKISGSGKVESDVTCTDGVISGSGHILGKVSSKNFKISGGGKIGGKLIGENIYISGIGAVEQDIEADKVEVSGGIRVEGMLNADMVNMELNGSSQVKEIGATKINVKESIGRDRGILGKFFNIIKGFGKLTVDVIEGDDIYLENTIAKVVRGERITIGKGCEIDRIEYRENYRSVDENSIIKVNTKV